MNYNTKSIPDLPEDGAFDILDATEKAETGRGAQCEGVEGGSDAEMNPGVWDKSRYTLMASVAAAYHRDRNRKDL